MPESCCVVGCTLRRGEASRREGLHFFAFPSNRLKRAAWQRAVNRKNWKPQGWERICSRHFVDNCHSDDPSDVNYRPTLFMGKPKPSTSDMPGRFERQHRREVVKVSEYFCQQKGQYT